MKECPNCGGPKSSHSALCFKCLTPYQGNSVISRWNPKWNDILEMYFNGATYKEIAEFAGTTLETVSGRFARMRSRGKLDVIMGVYVGDRPPRGIHTRYDKVFIPIDARERTLEFRRENTDE